MRGWPVWKKNHRLGYGTGWHNDSIDTIWGHFSDHCHCLALDLSCIWHVVWWTCDVHGMWWPSGSEPHTLLLSRPLPWPTVTLATVSHAAVTTSRNQNCLLYSVGGTLKINCVQRKSWCFFSYSGTLLIEISDYCIRQQTRHCNSRLL